MNLKGLVPDKNIENKGNKKRVALYIRVSTQEQAADGYSIQAQEQVGREYAKRMGYEVVKVYIDEGESGKSTKHRLAYQQMMKDAKLGIFDLVVIWKLTRLGRNMLDTLITVEELLLYSIGLHSISEQFDITNSTGKLMLQLLGSFAEFERNQISENVQMTMQSLVRDQKRYAGGRRLGYISGEDATGKKQLLIEPEEAKIIQLVYAKYLGGEGYRAIANYLNRQGYQTVKKNNFSTTAVKDILHNKIYGGYLEYARYLNWDTKRRKGKNPNPILVKGEHQPIIDEQTYQAVQERISLEDRSPQWNQSGENLLTGLLRCPECGAPMAASNVTNTVKGGIKKRIRYYSCSQFRNKGASVCHANSIRADKAEAFVAARLKEIVQNPIILKQLIKELNQELVDQIKPLEQEVAVISVEKEEINGKLTRLYEAVEDSPELLDSVKERLGELTLKRKNYQLRENEILTVLQHQGEEITIKNVQSIINGLDVLLTNREKREVKQIYRTFIDRITFDPLNKNDIKLYMTFDQTIIDQLNEHYKAVVSESTDATLFVLKTRFTLSI
ncbi:recombinase family protein [Enterococcus sp. BWR-S5]|uniref:recombinase family protein n=1 Tax=Enterococcus sp. BWR-S5 TaxID=2787714 RepID=UPI0019241EFE|nr:recombinase family protein [Enterococcus sp. BWR-S5]MBL1224203.1 recombinase family protein [Enterococcus sp. BWR-S5]